MITRQDFIEKLEEWLTEETCNRLADIAEKKFSNIGFFSCYELMLIAMADYHRCPEFTDLESFIISMDGRFGIELEPGEDGDVEGLVSFMEEEW